MFRPTHSVINQWLLLNLLMNPDNILSTCFNDLYDIIFRAWSISCTRPIILGNHRHQFFIFGCILSQLITTLLLISIYYDSITLSYVWWPGIECIRISISGQKFQK